MTHHKLFAHNWMAQCCWPPSDGESGLLLWVSRLVVGGPRRVRTSFAPRLALLLRWRNIIAQQRLGTGALSAGGTFWYWDSPREACLCSFGVSWHKFCVTLSGLPSSARCLLSPHLSQKKKQSDFCCGIVCGALCTDIVTMYIVPRANPRLGLLTHRWVKPKRW